MENMKQKLNVKKIVASVLIVLLVVVSAFAAIFSVSGGRHSQVAHATVTNTAPWNILRVDPQNAGVPRVLHHGHLSHSQPLFTTTGTGLNASAIGALQAIMQHEIIQNQLDTGQPANAAHFSQVARTFDGTNATTYNPLFSGAIYVDLTQTVGAVPAVMPAAPTNAQLDAAFTSRLWRAVNFDGNILTLYMAEPYRNSAFQASGNANYATSTLRTNLNADFDRVLNLFPALDNAIVNPSAVAWHSGQTAQRSRRAEAGRTAAQVSTQNGVLQGSAGGGSAGTLPTAAENDGTWATFTSFDFLSLPLDRIFIPSNYETVRRASDGDATHISHHGWRSEVGVPYWGRTNRTGLWGMNAFDRGWQGNLSGTTWVDLPLGLSSIAWSRSTSSIAGRAGTVDVTGGSTRHGRAVASLTGVRPALHIDLDYLARSANLNAGWCSDVHTPPAASTSLPPAAGGAGPAFPGGGVVLPYQAGRVIRFDAGTDYTVDTVRVHLTRGTSTASALQGGVEFVNIPITAGPDPGSWVNINAIGVTNAGRARAWYIEGFDERVAHVEFEFRHFHQAPSDQFNFRISARPYLSAVNTLRYLRAYTGVPGQTGSTVMPFVNPFNPTMNLIPNIVQGTHPFAMQSVYIFAEAECDFAEITSGTGLMNLTTNPLITSNISDTVTVSVTAQNGTVRNYAVIVNRLPASDDAHITNVTVQDVVSSGLPNVPLSIHALNQYAGNIGHDVGLVIVDFDFMQVGASATFTVTAGGGSFDSDNGLWSQLDEGINTLRITVTAENTTTQLIYYIHITRAESDGTTTARLTNLFLRNATGGANTPIPLNPNFHFETLTYNVSVPYTVTSIEISATAFGGGNVTGQLGIHNLPTDGVFTFVVTANAQTGGAATVYTINITRLAASSDATLSSLAVVTPSALELSPAFNQFNLHYTLEVGHNVTSVTLLAIASDGAATIEVSTNNTSNATFNINNNQIIWSGLVVGINTITIRVTAGDGAWFEYEIELTMVGNPDETDSSLRMLGIRGVQLDSPFAPGVTEIFATVPWARTTIDITAIPNRASASVAGAGVQSLTAGINNVFTITVTAGDDSQSIYIVTVFREMASTDSSIHNIWFNNITFTFIPGQTINNITVPFATASTIISASYEPFATVTGLGIHSLQVGMNTITIFVTAQAGGTPTEYTFIITRETGVDPPCCCEDIDVCFQILINALEHIQPLFNSTAANYTEVSMAIVRAELDRGIDTLGNQDATQNQVNAAAARIHAAWAARAANNITPPTNVNRDRLIALLNIAEPHMDAHGERYTALTAFAAHEAIRIGLLARDNIFTTQAQIDFAADSLEDALSRLVVRTGGPEFPANVNRNALRDLRAYVLAHMNNPVNWGAYAPGSISAINGALTNANSWYFNIESTQADINSAYTLLRNAFDSRVPIGGGVDPIVNRTALWNLIQQAQARMENNPTTYTLPSMMNLIDEIGRAISSHDDPYATQALINAAYANLRAAYDALQTRIPVVPPTGGGIWQRLQNIWGPLPWLLFLALPLLLLLIVLAVVIGVIVAKKRRENEEEELDESGVPVSKKKLSDLRIKARDAVSKAFAELKYAGECVIFCDANHSQQAEKTAMDQLVKTEKAMLNAEECVGAYLAEKKAQQNKGKKKKKKKAVN